jgi:hypothetical protein
VDHLSAGMPFGEWMARRTFYVIDITEILAHWYAGRSQYDVAGSLGVDHKTIRRYVEPAIAAGFVPGGTPPMNQDDWAPLVKQWFPHLTDTRLRQVTWPEFAKPAQQPRQDQPTPASTSRNEPNANGSTPPCTPPTPKLASGTTTAGPHPWPDDIQGLNRR